MKTSDKLAIVIGIVSIVTTIGSIYYYNETYTKASLEKEVKVEKKSKEKDKEVIVTKNIELKTEVKNDNLLVVNFKNISKRDLIDVVFEITFKNLKIGEIYLENFIKDDERIIEFDLTKTSKSPSIKENNTIIKDYRLLENFEFFAGDNKGEILVSSLKELKLSDYPALVDNSSLENDKKTEIKNKIKEIKNKNEIEKILEKNNVYDKIKLSEDVIHFGNNKKLEIKNTDKVEEKAKDVVSEQVQEEVVEQPVVRQPNPTRPITPPVVQPSVEESKPKPVLPEPKPVEPKLEPVQPSTPNDNN